MSLGLNVTDAKVSFGTSTILDHITLSIPTGEATAIIGPAASGKSVLFKYILDLLDGQEPKLEFFNICLLYTSPSPRD